MNIFFNHLELVLSLAGCFLLSCNNGEFSCRLILIIMWFYVTLCFA